MDPPPPKKNKKSNRKNNENENGEVDVGTAAYFSNEETTCLLSIYKQNQYMFKKNQKKHYVVWKKIAEDMKTNFHEKDEGKCNNRIVNLKRQYMNIKRSLRSGDEEPEWKYYKTMNEIFGPKPTANPEIQIDSVASGSSTGSLQELFANEESSVTKYDFFL